MTIKLEANLKLIECFTLTKMLNGQEWMKVMIEPNDATVKDGSTGGGNFTVILPNHVGTTYYSNGDNTTLKAFLADTNTSSIVTRLFGSYGTTNVENGEELIEWAYSNNRELIFEARQSGEISKKELRLVFDELMGVGEFEDPNVACKDLTTETNEILNRMFGEDFWWSSISPEKPCEAYKYQYKMIAAFQQFLKGQMNEKV